LYIAYQNKTDDEQKIKEISMKDKVMKKFLNRYFLIDKNDYYKQNKKRLSKISAKQIRELRNSLTHFFSLSRDISINSPTLSVEARKIETMLKKQRQNNSIFISPEDLHELIKNAIVRNREKCEKILAKNS